MTQPPDRIYLSARAALARQASISPAEHEYTLTSVAEAKLEEMRKALEFVINDGRGREFYPFNLDGSRNEIFDNAEQLLAHTETKAS